MNAVGIMEHEPRVVPAAQKRRVFVALSMRGSQFLGKRSLMGLLVNILANKIFAFSVIIGVGFWLLIIPAFIGALGANPAENLLHQTAKIGIRPLAAFLSLSPFAVWFPR